MDCAVDSADVTDVERFAGKEETVGNWFGKILLSGETVNGNITVGAARKWIMTPVVKIRSL